MSDPEDDELPLASAIREMLQSEGWKWFCQQVDAEFGPPGIARRLNTIRAELPRGPGREFDLTAKVDALYEAADVVNALIMRPKEHLAKLTPKKPTTRLYDSFRRTVETHR